MKPAALRVKSIGVMQQAAFAMRINFKPLHATKQPFACHPNMEACSYEHCLIPHRCMICYLIKVVKVLKMLADLWLI